MTTLQPFFDQLNLYLSGQATGGFDARMLLIGAFALVGGGLLSVFGAKLARGGLTVALALGGMTIGAEYGARLGLPGPVAAILAGAMLGTIGFLTFRLWAGVLTGLVACGVAISVFGYREVAPHAADFQPLPVQAMTVQAGVESGADAVVTPSGELIPPAPREWMQQFWAYVRSQNASLTSDAEPIIAAALLVGLFLGVLAVRAMLILSTSLLGTSLIFGGAITLLGQVFPTSLSAMERSPGAVGMALGGFLVSSLILQALLTRKRPEGEAERSK
ncbi:MAG: hypothetical protein J5J06_07690 [Phycisphaerae bacterium]|nr:hypothetical protein [Phycisphaerae bacterium]